MSGLLYMQNMLVVLLMHSIRGCFLTWNVMNLMTRFLWCRQFVCWCFSGGQRGAGKCDVWWTIITFSVEPSSQECSFLDYSCILLQNNRPEGKVVTTKLCFFFCEFTWFVWFNARHVCPQIIFSSMDTLLSFIQILIFLMKSLTYLLTVM